MTTEEEWRRRSDEELTAAVGHLSDYTEETQRIILAEVRRRGITAEMPAPIVQTADPEVKLFCVLRTGDASVIALIKSVFEAENIDYFVKGEGLQDLFGWGRFAGGYNYALGPVEFIVRSTDADRARGLVRQVEAAASEQRADDDE